MSQLDDFVAAHDGQYLNFYPGDTDQCVDLADAWSALFLATLPPIPAAVDFATQGAPGWDWVVNTPTNVPSPGDLVVWGYEVGPFGHIALFLEGDTQSFTSFDQNWPLGAPCHRVRHDYAGVLGWLHLQEVTTVTDQDFQQLQDRVKAVEDWIAQLGSPNLVNINQLLGNLAADADARGFKPAGK